MSCECIGYLPSNTYQVGPPGIFDIIFYVKSSGNWFLGTEVSGVNDSRALVDVQPLQVGSNDAKNGWKIMISSTSVPPVITNQGQSVAVGSPFSFTPNNKWSGDQSNIDLNSLCPSTKMSFGTNDNMMNVITRSKMLYWGIGIIVGIIIIIVLFMLLKKKGKGRRSK